MHEVGIERYTSGVIQEEYQQGGVVCDSCLHVGIEAARPTYVMPYPTVLSFPMLLPHSSYINP